MADGFAIAAVSHAIRARIASEVRAYIRASNIDGSSLGDFAVVSKAPELLASDRPSQPTITVFPWFVAPDLQWGLSIAPQEPRPLAIDISYVVAGYSPPSEIAVDRCLGWALLALHETPRLTPELLIGLSEQAQLDSPHLAKTLEQLSEQRTPIFVEPIRHELEAFSQIWSALNTGAETGAVYRVGKVLIESPRRAASAPRVREARTLVSTIRSPRIERIAVTSDPAIAFQIATTARPGDLVRLLGSGLLGDHTSVSVGEISLPVDESSARAQRIQVELPSDLYPGIYALRVMHAWPKPEGQLAPAASGLIKGERSNTVPLSLLPVLDTSSAVDYRSTGTEGEAEVTLSFRSGVGSQQALELLLNGKEPDERGRVLSYAFTAAKPAPEEVEATVTERTIRVRGIRPGTYLVRVVVDGAESELSEEHSPSLEVPE